MAGERKRQQTQNLEMNHQNPPLAQDGVKKVTEHLKGLGVQVLRVVDGEKQRQDQPGANALVQQAQVMEFQVLPEGENSNDQQLLGAGGQALPGVGPAPAPAVPINNNFQFQGLGLQALQAAPGGGGADMANAQQPQNNQGEVYFYQLPVAEAGQNQGEAAFYMPGFHPTQEDLMASIKALQLSQREQTIATEVTKHHNAAAKCSVGFLMKSIYLVKDIQKEWLQLELEAAQAGPGSQIATAENLPRVNMALTNQSKLIGELMAKLQHEYTLQTAGSLSGARWELVNFIEKKPIFNEEMAEFGLEDLRKFEKEKMSYDRDFKAEGAEGEVLVKILEGEEAEVAPGEAGEASEGTAEAAGVVLTMETTTATASMRPKTETPTQGSMGAATTANLTSTKSRIAPPIIGGPPCPRGNKLPKK